jgi:peptide/nickel transport system permease protein
MSANTLPNPSSPVAPRRTIDDLLRESTAVKNESYFQLVARRFMRSRVSIVGGLIVLTLTILALFAEFFSPNPIDGAFLDDAFIPPNQVRFIDAEGNFNLRPFVYGTTLTLDPKTFQPSWTENTKKKYSLQFFVRSWPYKLLGLISTDLHLIGVEEGGKLYMLGTDKLGRDMWGKAMQAGRISLSLGLMTTLFTVIVGSVIGVTSGYYGGRVDELLQRFVEFVNCFPGLPLLMSLAALVPKTADSLTVFLIMASILALLNWTTLAREVRGKALALRQSDFVLAAKEMGASDARIIFRHLLPNTLSHIIIVLTLSIPATILSESFLSFLGIGIQEPLISWGLMMRNAQNLQTLSQQQWIMTPALFIIAAVLGFNFLGDGLRDAADPYASR